MTITCYNNEIIKQSVALSLKSIKITNTTTTYTYKLGKTSCGFGIGWA